MRAPGTNLPFIKILKEALMQAPPNGPIKLYRHPLSGHSHRVELFVHLLGLPITLIDVDLGGGGQKAPAFLALNRFGQVPVIDDGGTVVADANAILTYLALKYGADHWVPREPLAAARVQQWLSQAAGALARGAATARAINVFRLDRDTTAAVQEAHWLLTRVEGSLRTTPADGSPVENNRPSPMSRCTPTRRTRPKAALRWTPIRRCATGSRGWRGWRASCRWRGRW